MGALSEAGLPLAVIGYASAGGCVSIASHVVREGTEGLVVDFSEDTEFIPGDDVLVLAGRLGSRLAVPGRVTATTGRLGVIAFHGSWRPFDVRGSARPGGLQALVRSRLGTSRQPARVVDADGTGMVVEVPRKPGGREVDVDLAAGGYSACISCRLEDAEIGEEQALLRLTFGALSPPHRAFMRTFQESLWQAFAVPVAA